MKTYYSMYIREATGEGIADLNDVLDGVNGFLRIGLLDEGANVEIDKAFSKILAQGQEHIFTEKVKLNGTTYDIESDKCEIYYNDFNNNFVDVCFKSNQIGSTSVFVENIKCSIKIEMQSNELSKVTMSANVELKDASEFVSFHEVA